MKIAVGTADAKNVVVFETGLRYKDNKERVITQNEAVREECITALWRNTGTVPVWVSDTIKLGSGESMTVEGSLHCQFVDGVLYVVPIRKVIDTTVRWDYADIEATDEPVQELVLVLTDLQYPNR